MRRLAGLVAALILAGCAQQGLTLIPESDLPDDVYGSPPPAPEPEKIPANGTIYLVGRRHLEATTVRLQPVLNSAEEALLVALFQQSPPATEIPEGTRLNGVQVSGGIATVDVSGDFERAAPPRSQALRIAQVVYTLTEEATGIVSVRFEIDGVPQQAIGGAQLGAIPGPVSRADYEDFAPRSKEKPRGRT